MKPSTDADFLRKKQTERLTADDSAAIIIGTLGQVKSDAPCLIKKAYRRIKETGVNTLILEDDIHILRDMRNELKRSRRMAFIRPSQAAHARRSRLYIEEDTSTILTPLFAHDLSLLAYMYMGLMHMH